MWNDCILYVSYLWFSFSPNILFWTFWIWSLRFLKYLSHHDINEECILLADTQHSQAHMNFYCTEFLLSWGDNSELNVESMIMVLLYASLASFGQPFTGSLTGMLWSYRKDTCCKIFETIFVLVWPPMFNFRQ